jgi:hypothetical protein
LLLVLIVGASAIVLYGVLIDTSGLRLPMIVSGFAVLGIASGILGFSLATAAVRLGQHGRGWAALGLAFAGGLFVLVAAGSLAGAIVLGILTTAS